MLSKMKRPVLILILVLICVQVFQILYREHVFEITRDDTGDSAVENKAVNVVNGNLEQAFANDQKIKEHNNKNAHMSSTSTSTSTTTTTTTTSTTSSTTSAANNDEMIQQKRPNPEPLEKVTDEVQAHIAEVIGRWKAAQGKREIIDKNFKYDGRDLLKDPVFKFNPHFKNPCWFESEKLRCLPYVYVIGVKKCGTSDLFYRMSQHPDFVGPGFKEAQWFARKRFRSGGIYDNIYEYVSMFGTAAKKILANSNTSDDGQVYNYKQITGEGSPSNLHLNTHWKHLPGNENLDEPKYVILDYIHHFIPQAKIIITFRNPVDRLYSDYYHEYGSLMKQNKPNPRQFHKVVSAGVKLYQDCFKRRSVRSCVYEPSLYEQTKIQIQLGIYYILWEDLTRLYPRDQILVLQNENLRDKETTMKTVYQFLQLRNLSYGEMELVVTRKETYTRRESFKKEGPMLDETLKILRDFYRPFNKKMSEITGDSDFLYSYADEDS